MSAQCPVCSKPVYFAERITSYGKDYHRTCLKCEKCSKTLVPGKHSARDGKNYCERPCYAALFGPKGFGYGGINNCPPETAKATEADPAE